jgi:hypothetical protein
LRFDVERYLPLAIWRRAIFASCNLALSDIRLLRCGVERYSPLAMWRRAIFASSDLASSDIRFLRCGVERYSLLAIWRRAIFVTRDSSSRFGLVCERILRIRRLSLAEQLILRGFNFVSWLNAIGHRSLTDRCFHVCTCKCSRAWKPWRLPNYYSGVPNKHY